MKKKIVHFDMDNVLMDFESGIKQLYNKELKEYEGRLDEVPGIFKIMKPLDGAVDAFNLIAEKYDVYILSTAPWNNQSAWGDKLYIIKKYFGENAYKRLTLSHHKNLVIGDYLIDDRTANGAGQFTGEHIHFGTDKFPDWKTVVEYLMDR